ncbi:MAG TPA: hypothetical protein VLD16_04900 [Gaiellaceae bacterium]|nr:hypothetical protein [Gaiellaceae bacterium]
MRVRIEGTYYEVMLTGSGHHVYVRTAHGEPVAVAGPFPSHRAAVESARERASQQRAWRSFSDRPVGPRGGLFWGP